MVNEQKKYLLDSDILITMLRDKTGSSGLRQKALNAGLQNCYVSSLSIAELTFGAYRMDSKRGLFEVDFIKTIFNILPFGMNDSSDMGCFGRTKALLFDTGTPIADIDLLIGASALAGGYIMVTHNTKHFSHIPRLQIEDWLTI